MTRVRQLLVTAALAIVAIAVCAASTISDHTFHSAALKQTLPYRIILPTDYAQTTTRYPVLYLLHGYAGAFSNWGDRTSVVGDAAGLALIIVMPEGNNSWYIDGANGEAWAAYLTHDLVAEIDTTYRTVATRRGRMIAGLSMGGYGAIRAGLTHPELYSFVGSFSGALDITKPGDVFGGERHPDVMSIFGPLGSDVRKKNDVYALASAAIPSTLPYFWIACGTSDPWIEPNREMARTLRSRGIAVTYQEHAGTHDWQFWDWAIKSMLSDPRVSNR